MKYRLEWIRNWNKDKNEWIRNWSIDKNEWIRNWNIDKNEWIGNWNMDKNEKKTGAKQTEILEIIVSYFIIKGF